MYMSIKEAIKEIKNNNYTVIKVKGIIEFTMCIRKIRILIDTHRIYLGNLENRNIKVNSHQIMKIIKESDKIIIELDSLIKIYVLKNKNIL